MPESRTKDLKDSLKEGVKNVWSNVIKMVLFLLLLTATLCASGGIVHLLEKAAEKERKIAARQFRIDFNVTDEFAAACTKAGWCSFPSDEISEWGFIPSVFWSMTAVTTIGYGRTSPSTPGGKAYTVIFSVLGIGLVGITLSEVAIVTFSMLSSVTKLWNKRGIAQKLDADAKNLSGSEKQNLHLSFEKIDVNGDGYLDKQELTLLLAALNKGVVPTEKEVDFIYKQADTDGNGRITEDELAHTVALWYQTKLEMPEPLNYFNIGLGCSVFAFHLFLGGFVFAELEGWNYWDSFYFCFVTLSTIGFGDFTPVTTGGQVFCCIYAFFGLGTVAYLIQAISNMYQNEVDRFVNLFEEKTKDYMDEQGRLSMRGVLESARKSITRGPSFLHSPFGSRMASPMHSPAHSRRGSFSREQNASLNSTGIPSTSPVNGPTNNSSLSEQSKPPVPAPAMGTIITGNEPASPHGSDMKVSFASTGSTQQRNEKATSGSASPTEPTDSLSAPLLSHDDTL